MNATHNDLRPSATVEEAVERFVAVATNRIAELTAQRDELARCLRDVLDGFKTGVFIIDFRNHDFAIRTIDFARLMSRCDVALADCPDRRPAP